MQHTIMQYTNTTMTKYTCEKCGKIFKQKSGYTDHQSKKNDCSQNTIISAIIQSAVETKVKDAIRAIQPKPPITDKSMLPSFFEDLHNLLWNKAGLSPEKALEHMTFFFAYRLIEQQADTLILPQECRWSYIANIQNDQDLFDTVRRGVTSFRNNTKTKPFFRPHEIQRCDLVAEIVQQINRISLTILQETDTLGDVFEYMLGRGMSTMSDEGQYFTNREICRIAFKLSYQIKQTLRRGDGSLCTFGDWFCGTGGFPAEYVKGVKTHLPDIDWQAECGSIYCQDMNTGSVTTTLLNMLILTGIPFSDQNIRSSNSFTDNIVSGVGAPFPELSLDYNFMNPPYGGDKTKGKEYKFAYSKIVKAEDGTKTKRFYVNPDIQSIGIEDDDKVSAGVQLGMATLAPTGVCSLVLPQGFFFGASKKYVELRKKIAEEYKIWYVVDIASGSFINTGTKTSMIVFQKGVGPTERVSFIGLDESLLVEATLEELVAKNYSLNYKQYMPQNVVEVEGFEMVKLGDIVTITTGKNKTPDDKKGEMYPYYGTSGITGYTDHFLEDGDYILTARNGTIGNTFIINGKSYPSDHMFTIRTNQRCMLKYLYYWIMSNKNIMINLANVTTIPGITRASLVDIIIPLPSLERQQQIVESIDGFTQLAHHEEQSLKMLEKQVMFFVKEMGRGQPRVKLGDVCVFQRGKMITKKELVYGEFPVIGGGLSPMGYHTASNRNAYACLISQSGENAGHISRYTKPVWASDCFSVSSSKMNDDFMYYLLLQIQDEINFLKTGTAQPHIYPSSIDSLTIVVPTLTHQETLQSEFEEIKHKHSKIAEYKKKAQDAIKLLIPGA
jgi:type I restriction enzyme S subunit